MPTLAIDFGTTRTKVAYFDTNKNRLELLEIGRSVRNILPTTFYVPKNYANGGKILIGDDADEESENDPVGYVVALKKEIHKGTKLILGPGRKIERIELASHLFRHVKNFAEKNVPYFHKQVITDCTLTVPVVFSEPQRQAIAEAARRGGFTNIIVVEEPVAAAQAYLHETQQQDIDTVVIVCDIGGGTTDFAAVQRKNGQFYPVPGGSSGIELGGDDLDEMILKESGKSQSFWNRIFDWFSSFKSKIKRHKEGLSRNTKDVYDVNVKDVKLPVSKKIFDDCIKDFSEQICENLEKFLNQVQNTLGKDNVPILLVGGSSKLVGLEDKIKEKFSGRQIITWQSSDYAIVLGAALRDNFQKNQQVNQPTQAKLLQTVRVILTWSDADYDLDLSAFLLDKTGKAVDLVYYGKTKSNDRGVLHTGDEEGGAGAEELVTVTLNQIDKTVQRIVFVVTNKTGRNLNNLSNGAVKVLDSTQNKELATFDFGGITKKCVSFILGEVFQTGNEWNFKKSCIGSDKELADFANEYGAAIKGMDSLEAGSAAKEFQLGKQAYDRKDFAEAFKHYCKAAEQNSAEGQAGLGDCYFEGKGVPKNYDEAVKWYRKAAEQNCAEGQVGLGLCYFLGKGVLQDDDEAIKLFRKSAEQNCAEGQAGLGMCFQLGKGVPQDEAEAVKWYRKAVEQNCAEGQVFLGMCFQLGSGVPQDDDEAVKWYSKSAEQNCAFGQIWLGRCYLNGTGVPQNYAEAVKWFRKAAEQEDADAQTALGNCYLEGNGVPQNYAEAVKWFRKAAEQENADGQTALGKCYFAGDGVPQNYDEAVKWFQKAANQDESEAAFYLFLCYEQGGRGVPVNESKGREWLIRSAEGGFQVALDTLLWRNFHSMPLPQANKDYIKKLVEKGANINNLDSGGDTILHFLMSAGNVTAADVSFVLDLDADVNIQNSKGETPLHIAVRDHWTLDIIRYLKMKGASSGIKDNAGQSPMDLAKARFSQSTEVQEIIR